MNKQARIYVAGHKGLVGSAILRRLISDGYSDILTRASGELDLREKEQVAAFFEKEKPEYVFFAAGKVGGIMANIKYPAEFIYDNLSMIMNVVDASHRYGVKKLLYLGSSCIYPKEAMQPIKEEYLLTGPLEETNKPYAMAKLAGIELCQSYNKQFGTDYICLVPTNLFGTNDNYDLEKSHLVAALIRKFYEAKEQNKKSITLWGSGNPLREVLSSDDLADACLYFMNNYSGSEVINIGSGIDHSVAYLATIIKDISGFSGSIEFDATKPDGMLKKQLDVNRASDLGWRASGKLVEDLRKAYQEFELNYEKYYTN